MIVQMVFLGNPWVASDCMRTKISHGIYSLNRILRFPRPQNGLDFSGYGQCPITAQPGQLLDSYEYTVGQVGLLETPVSECVCVHS